MNPKKAILVAATGLLATLASPSCAHRSSGELTVGESHFLREVKPLLEQRCLPCHNGTIMRGGFDLSSAATAFAGNPSGSFIVRGHPKKSRLLTVVLAPEDHPRAMPPSGHGLSEVEILILEEWIRNGAPWPDGKPGQLAPARGAEPRSVDARAISLSPIA